MRGGAYKYEGGGGGYTWIKTSVKEKEGLSAGEGAYRQRNSMQSSPI